MVNFTVEGAELELVCKIVDRIKSIPGLAYDDICGMTMDLDAVHSNGCPLDFQKLLDAPQFITVRHPWKSYSKVHASTVKEVAQP